MNPPPSAPLRRQQLAARPQLAAALALALACSALPAQSGTIYRLDSNSQGVPATLYAYDAATNVWLTRATMPVDCTTSLCSDGTEVFAMGTDANIYRYNAAGNNWVVHRNGPAAAGGLQVISMLETLNGQFFWAKDSLSTLWYSTGPTTWASIATPFANSCGSDVDRVAGRVYIRIYSQLGFMAFNPTTLTFSNCPQAATTFENSRAGAYYNGNFYTRDGSSPMQVINVGTCAMTPTAVSLITDHCGMAVSTTGLLYMNSWPDTTEFEVFNVVTLARSTLASPPIIAGNAHPALAFVGPRVRIVSVATAPTAVAPGQTGIAVDVMVMNGSATDALNVATIGLSFTGTAVRTAEYLVTPAPGNPTSIAAGATAAFAFTVNVLPSATEENIIVNAQITGTFVPSMTPVAVSGAVTTDSWDVVGARPAIRVVNSPDAMVAQGSLGHPVSIAVENVGLLDWVPGAITMSFTGTVDRTSEYSVAPAPGNPTLVTAGATETFQVSVGVSPSAAIETIVLDVASFAGTDALTGRPQADMGADVTDSWLVTLCAATLCGDCNGDGFITILDALVAAQHAAALIVLVGVDFTNCNVLGLLEPDPSAVVDVLDALRIAQVAAGLPVPLMCC